MITFLSYFIVPTSIFLTLVKLNNKRRWIVNKRSDYLTKNGFEVDKVLFWVFTTVFFIFWPIVIPTIIVILGVLWAIHWLTNGEGVIPSDNYKNRDNRY